MTLPDRYHELLTVESVVSVAQAIAAADTANPDVNDINAIHIVDHLDETKITDLDRWNTRPKRAQTDLIQAAYPVLADVDLIIMSDDGFMIIVQPGSHEILSDADAMRDLLKTLADAPRPFAEENPLPGDTIMDDVDADESPLPDWDDLKVDDDSVEVDVASDDTLPEDDDTTLGSDDLYIEDDSAEAAAPLSGVVPSDETVLDETSNEIESMVVDDAPAVSFNNEDKNADAASGGSSGDMLSGFSIHDNNEAAESGRSPHKRRNTHRRKRQVATNDDVVSDVPISKPETPIVENSSSADDTPPAGDTLSLPVAETHPDKETETTTTHNRPGRSNNKRSTSRRSTNKSADGQGNTRQPPWSSMKESDDKSRSSTRPPRRNRRGRSRVTDEDTTVDAETVPAADEPTSSPSSTRRGRVSRRKASSSSDNGQSSRRTTTRSSNRRGRRGSHQTTGPRARIRSGDTSSQNSRNTSPLETLSLPNGKTLQFSQYTLNKLIEEHGSLTNVIEWCLSHYSELSDDSDT